MEDETIFNAWLEAMEWDQHGGSTKAAEALGRDPKQIYRYKNGAKLSKEMRLAMTAIAQDLKPWEPKTEGTPSVYFKFSLG